MKKNYILTLLIAAISTPFHAQSASTTIFGSFKTVANYDITTNHDFSSTPLTKNNQIKQYNLDNFIADPSVHKSDLQGLGMQVTIDKYEVDGVVTVVVTYP
jgi:hypothetical protein